MSVIGAIQGFAWAVLTLSVGATIAGIAYTLSLYDAAERRPGCIEVKDPDVKDREDRMREHRAGAFILAGAGLIIAFVLLGATS